MWLCVGMCVGMCVCVCVAMCVCVSMCVAMCVYVAMCWKMCVAICWCMFYHVLVLLLLCNYQHMLVCIVLVCIAMFLCVTVCRFHVRLLTISSYFWWHFSEHGTCITMMMVFGMVFVSRGLLYYPNDIISCLVYWTHPFPDIPVFPRLSLIGLCTGVLERAALNTRLSVPRTH